MRQAWLIAIVAGALAGAGLAPAQVSSPAADESALLAVWKVHIETSTNDTSRILAACDEFQKKSPNNAFRPVVDGLVGWYQIRKLDGPAAVTSFERMVTSKTDPVSKASTLMAKRWLTRIDREKVRASLKLIYRDKIEFPPSLDAIKTLPEAQRCPLMDRWGQTWNYRLSEFKSQTLKSLRGQKYELQSALLGADSDLQKAIVRPYGGKINLKPSKMVSTIQGHESVEFVTKDEKAQKVVLAVGTDSAGISFCYIGPSMIILSDGDYWSIIPRSRQ